MRRFTLSLLLCLPFLPACRPAPVSPAATKPAADPAVDELLKLMRSRLEVMQDVARWKWTAKAPIEDPGREAALLKDVVERGSALGLDPNTTRDFFAAQIEAAKLVQRDCFRRWEAHDPEPPGEAPDLAKVLRPKIDALNRDLLAALVGAVPHLQANEGAAARTRSRANEILNGAGIDAEVRAAAIRPLVSATD